MCVAMERAIFIRCESRKPHKTERNGQKCRLKISLGCPNLAAFFSFCMLLWQEWEKWKASMTYSFHFLIEQENTPHIHGTEEVFQVNDNFQSEEWSPDGTSVTSCPSQPSPHDPTTVLERGSRSRCLPAECLHWTSLISCAWLFQGHILLVKSERLVVRTCRSFQAKYVLKRSTFITLEKESIVNTWNETLEPPEVSENMTGAWVSGEGLGS